jgi:NDP-sugar pyrophosphorylase family protein
MAGLGQRFKDAGQTTAKPFIQVGGKSVLKHLTDILPNDWKIFFAIGDHLKADDTEHQIQLLNKKNYKIIYVPYSARGPVDTVCAVIPFLDPDQPVLISYCDYTMIWDADDFVEKIKKIQADAAIISYKGFHPTYLGPNSYCHLQIGENNLVQNIQEKKLYSGDIHSEWTSCGMYYFKSVDFLSDCLSEQLKQNLCYKAVERSEYYTSLALLAMKNKIPELMILNYEIKYFIQFGTPFDIEKYKYWYDAIVLKSKIDSKSVEKNYWLDYFTQLIF